MVSKEIINMKELFLKELHEMDLSFKKDLEKILTSIDQKNKENEGKINLTIKKNEQLYYKMIKEKNEIEKIGPLLISHKKLNDIVISHELKMKELNLTNQRLTSNYDRIILDNLTVPGYIGNSCPYPTLSEYILHNINEIEKIKTGQEVSKKILDDFRYKIDNLMKNILNLLDNSIKRCNIYTDKKQKYLEEFVENKFVEINEKNVDLRAQIFTDINAINQHVDNFESQIKEVKDLKNIIKSEIDNILNNFQEKIKNEEKKLTKYIEDKIKNEFKKVINEEKANKAQAQMLMKQNKYIKRENKFSTMFSKPLTERKKDNLYNFNNAKASKNISEKIKEEKFDKDLYLNKKRSEVLTVQKDFKYFQMINKEYEDGNLSESDQHEKINIYNKSNENILINKYKKEEKNKEILEKNENTEIEDKQELKINKYKDFMYDEKKDAEQKENEEEKLFLKEDNKNKNKFKDDINIEKIVEKENESKSKETEENYIENKKEEEENNLEEKEKEDKNWEENEKGNNEVEEKEEEKNEEENNSFNYKEEKNQKKNKENLWIERKYHYENKEDNKMNLNIELKNEKIIKKENNEIKICPTEIRDNNTIQEDITNDMKNLKIPSLINEPYENKPKNEIIRNKIKGSRNETFQNNNLRLYQKNFNSFNNLKKKIKISNLKTEIEPINTSSKSISNSQTYIHSYKDKKQEKELKAINSERLIFNHTASKFYIKDKKYETIQMQTENRYNILSFPRLYCNFKLINLGSNIHFIKKELRLEQSKDKNKENKKLSIDFMSPIINTYKAYQKKKKEKKINNMYQNKISLNEQKKIEFELKGETIKFPNFKNNYSLTSQNFYNNNKKNHRNVENQTELK